MINRLFIFAEGAVYLRRNVNILTEDGQTYSITVCVSDPAHSLQGEVCGALTVTFISMYILHIKVYYDHLCK